MALTVHTPATTSVPHLHACDITVVLTWTPGAALGLTDVDMNAALGHADLLTLLDEARARLERYACDYAAAWRADHGDGY